MGAIAVHHRAHSTADDTALRAMVAAAPHRGAQVRSLTIGGTALAAVHGDALPDALVATDGSLALAFVGTVDNDAALRADLRDRGLAPPDDSREALLLAAARTYGDELPTRLRGVFAGVVSDGRSVTAFRDHLGYRPLFHRSDVRGFVVASEAKQVVAGAGIAKRPDIEVVERIVFNAIDDAMPSALRGVSRLPKSSAIRWSGDSVRQWRYWEPERLLETARYSAAELQERFDTLMGQAVTRCMTGPDVVSLSGGIDSPAIAAYGAPRHLERYGTPLQAQTVIYPGYPSVDERRYVEPLAEFWGLPLQLYEQHADPLDGVASWVSLTDTPYRSGALAQYAEDYKRAADRGLRTVLTGEHAEFVAAMSWFRFEHFVTHGRFAPARRQLRERAAAGRSAIDQARFIARSLAPAGLMALRHRFERPGTPRLPAWISETPHQYDPPPSVRARWRGLQLTAFIGPGISLEAEEVVQAVCGVRSRKPWTDVDLWELFLSLHAEQKYPDAQPKSLVRKLLRGHVPDFILDRQDKTLFDEAGLAEIDYTTLHSYLDTPAERLRGVDYAALRRRLDARDLTIIEYGWARTLCTAHAFLAQWGS